VWTCPECGKKFRNKNQWHSCYRVSLEDHIELEFHLGRLIEDFPVHRAIRISGNRVLHFVFLQNPADVDELLMAWLEESYRLVSKA
jgi:hypothetical protein